MTKPRRGISSTTPVTATPASVINPKHYDIVVKGQRIQVVDIIEARFPQDAHLSQALKYLLRAGHKTDSSYVKDIGKCIWWCVRALMFAGVKHIELPEGAPIGKLKADE